MTWFKRKGKNMTDKIEIEEIKKEEEDKQDVYNNVVIDDIRNFIDRLELAEDDIKALAHVILRFAPGDKDIKEQLNRITSTNINVRPWGAKE